MLYCKFKHILFLVLLAAVFGCSKIDDGGLQDNGISFSPMSVSGTRASTLIGGANEEAFRNEPFAVYGDWILDGSRTEVFRDTRVSYSTDPKFPTGWGYDPVKTWQVSGEYDFRAYWPASANVMGTASAQNLALEYNMLLENHDMMVAWLHCPTRNGGNPVDLNFHHTLAAVAVKFQSPDTEYEYRLKNLFFTSLNYIGALPYNLTDDTQDVTSSWVYAEGSRGYVDTENIMASERLREWSSSQGRVIPVSAQDYPLEFDLMLPQSLKVPQGVASPSITFTVQMKNSSQQEDITMTVSLPSTNSAGNEMIWRAGKKYIYEITVLPDKFDVVVKTAEWDEVLGSVGDIIF